MARIDDLFSNARKQAAQQIDLARESRETLTELAERQVVQVVEGVPTIDDAFLTGTNREVAGADYILASHAGAILLAVADMPSEALGGLTPLQALRRIRA